VFNINLLEKLNLNKKIDNNFLNFVLQKNKECSAPYCKSIQFKELPMILCKIKLRAFLKNIGNENVNA